MGRRLFVYILTPVAPVKSARDINQPATNIQVEELKFNDFIQ